ncbi:MAG: hypothetical protein CMJ83_05115 [Planctomycetes bacterium]|nr:hypothetical protein [Planctomycetota bacterium]
MAAVICAAQPNVIPPNFSVSLQANGIAASGESMALDSRDNAYILDRTNSPFSSDSITRVTPNGTVTPNHVTNVGLISQLAYNPADGFCYFAASSPVLPVIMSSVHRIEPNGGSTQIGNVPLIVRGLTITDDGRFVFGAQASVTGPGLFRWTPGTAAIVPLGPGFGQNAILQSLARTGDVLIADGFEVRRWTPLAIGPLPYWSPGGVIPNTIPRVNSLARSSANQNGVGALIGFNELTTLCICGTGFAFRGDLTQGSNAPFATENYSAPRTGLCSLATGIRQNMVWLTDVGITTGGQPGKFLWRVDQDVAVNSQGSLIVDVLPNLPMGSNVVFNVYGPAAGGDPFVLGTIPQPTIGFNEVFLPPFGWMMNIFHPAYVPLLDGVGLFGPANPFAVIPPGGAFQLSITVPPVGNLVFDLQALTLAGDAPNGYFFISNLTTVTLP